MRRLVILLPLLLTACHDEPSFDERYDKAAKEIEARTKTMDADIADAEKAAAVTEPGAKPLPIPENPANSRPSSGE